MNIARFLTEERIVLDLDDRFDDEPPPDVDAVVECMADLLEHSSVIVNATRLRQDLLNSQRRTPSLLGEGLFLPHVRTLQARRLALAVAISRNGLDLGADDDIPVRLVIAMVGPTYDDKQYLQFYKRLSERLESEGAVERVLAAELPGEVLRELSG